MRSTITLSVVFAATLLLAFGGCPTQLNTTGNRTSAGTTGATDTGDGSGSPETGTSDNNNTGSSDQATGTSDGTGSDAGADEGTDTGTGDTSTDNGGSTSTEKVGAFLPIAIDEGTEVDELPEDADDEDVQSGAPVRSEFERVVRSAATIIHRFNKLANRALALGAAIRDDMTDPNQTQVEATLKVLGVEVPYKVDFAAFDMDGDGTPDGSGNAVDVPVALRMWVDRGEGYERFLCAVIATKPSTENIGSGELYFRPAAPNEIEPNDVQIHALYDRTDEAHKWNLAYVTGRYHPLYRVPFGLARVDVRTNTDGGVEKTVRTAGEYAENLYGFETFQSAAHWLVGGSNLLASAAVSGAVEIGFTNVCLDLPTRSLAPTEECAAFDTQDMTFLDVPQGDETVWPTDFPEQPTF